MRHPSWNYQQTMHIFKLKAWHQHPNFGSWEKELCMESSRLLCFNRLIFLIAVNTGSYWNPWALCWQNPTLFAEGKSIKDSGIAMEFTQGMLESRQQKNLFAKATQEFSFFGEAQWQEATAQNRRNKAEIEVDAWGSAFLSGKHNSWTLSRLFAASAMILCFPRV